MSEPPFSRTAHHGRDSSAQNIHTAAPDSLAGALTFTAQRFVAIATELDEARAKLAAVALLPDAWEAGSPSGSYPEAQAVTDTRYRLAEDLRETLAGER